MRNFFYMKLDSRADLRIEKPGNEMKEKVIRIDEVDDFCLQKKKTPSISRAGNRVKFRMKLGHF